MKTLAIVLAAGLLAVAGCATVKVNGARFGDPETWVASLFTAAVVSLIISDREARREDPPLVIGPHDPPCLRGTPGCTAD